MLEANCTIVLSYFSNETSPNARAADTGRFSYHCIASSTGWAVMQDGTIVPPSQGRIVTIRLGYPAEAQFTGFQLAADPARLPPESLDPWYVESSSGARILQPQPFPPLPGSKVAALTIDLAGPHGLLYYRLAVNGVWDDPKIYNDPIE